MQWKRQSVFGIYSKNGTMYYRTLSQNANSNQLPSFNSPPNYNAGVMGYKLKASSPCLTSHQPSSLLDWCPILNCCHLYGLASSDSIYNKYSIMLSLLASFFTFSPTDSEFYLLFTYRSNITSVLPTTYYESDAGWGCMLRVCQMAMINFLVKRQNKQPLELLPLAWDNSNKIFSIQNITRVGASICSSKKPYDWFSPCEASFIFKEIIEAYDSKYFACVCNDNSIFRCQFKPEKENIIIVNSMLGLNEPQKEKLEVVIELMRSRFFVSIMGGYKKNAHLFLKQKEGQLGYLDPHKTYQVDKSIQEMLENRDRYLGRLQWLKKHKINSSVAMIFFCLPNELEQFWNELLSLKEIFKEHFFLYIDDNPPEIDMEEPLIEINM